MQAPEQYTVDALMCLAIDAFDQSDTPGLDAEVLLCHASGLSRALVLADGSRQLDAKQVAAFLKLIDKRRQGQPIAYLTGTKEFYSLPFKVTPDVLIPRPETELLVDTAVALLPQHGILLDMGTGSGAIALAVAHNRPDCTVLGLDASAAAIAIAQENQKSLKLNNVQFIKSDWFSTLDADFRADLIVSNPPYIDPTDPHLQQGDVRFEPVSALVSDKNGLADIEIISKAAPRYLKSGGSLFFEHGWDQAQAVSELLQGSGIKQIATQQDLAGHKRVTGGSKSI